MLFIPETVAQIPLNVAFKYDGSRLEAPLKNIFLAANASIIALQSIDPKVRHLGAGFATMHGGVLGLTIDFPCPQLFISSAGDDITPHLWIRLRRTAPYREGDYEAPLDPVRNTIEDAIKAQFILFYEDGQGSVRDHANHDRNKWDPVWAFARVVRNAIGHGKVNISDPTFPPVSWHGIEFGPKQNGAPLFGGSFAPPDLILLLLEMHFALVRLDSA